jgi:predicted dehydrogenase
MPKIPYPKSSRRKFLRGLGASALAISSETAVSALTSVRRQSGSSKASPRIVRIGVVGGGFGSHFQWHLHPNCKVTAVCDLRDDRLKVLKHTYRAVHGYREYQDFLKHPELDAVAIFTPAPYHASMAIDAMKRGKHVISAVPTGMSVEELEKILEAVTQTGQKYMLAETSRYRPDTMSCIEWARQGKFGNIFYSEAEYHHSGLAPYAWGTTFDCQSCEFIESIDKVKHEDIRAKLIPTWSHGYPPMLYPDHSTGFIVPVTGERLVEVTAHGWGDDQEMLKKNYYNNNPFVHTVGLFKTSGGNSARISIGWHIAHGPIDRATFYGDRMSYIMGTPECRQDRIVEQKDEGPWGIYGGITESRESPSHLHHLQKLPESLRIETGHGNSHAFITHEFISAILEDRQPKTNIWEAIAFTLPGIIAHESALRGGVSMKIKDYGTAPG